MSAVDNAFAKMQKTQRNEFAKGGAGYSMQLNIVTLAGFQNSLEEEVKFLTQKLNETPIAKQLAEKRKKLKEVKEKYRDCVNQFNGAFNIATGYDKDTRVVDKWTKLFDEMETKYRDMEEEEEEIQRIEGKRK